MTYRRADYGRTLNAETLGEAVGRATLNASCNLFAVRALKEAGILTDRACR